MVTTQELVERYPLKLVPLAGELSALVWHTHNDGHHAVIGPSPPSVVSAYARIRDSRLGGGNPKAWWSMRVVAPPPRYVERAAEVSYRNDVDSFRSWLFCVVDSALGPDAGTEYDYDARVRECAAARRALPAFRPCPYVDPTWFAEELGDASDDATVERARREQAESRAKHWSCAGDCYEGLAPAAGTWADLYEAHRGVWEEDVRARRERVVDVDGSRRRPDPRRPLRTDLPAPDPGRPLFAARPDFGHHCDGLVFKQMSDDYLTEPFAPDGVLFFFQGERSEVPEAVLELVRADRERQARVQEGRAAKREVERQAEFARMRALFDRIFPVVRP
jgi:hypothetical protein